MRLKILLLYKLLLIFRCYAPRKKCAISLCRVSGVMLVDLRTPPGLPFAAARRYQGEGIGECVAAMRLKILLLYKLLLIFRCYAPRKKCAISLCRVSGVMLVDLRTPPGLPFAAARRYQGEGIGECVAAMRLKILLLYKLLLIFRCYAPRKI